MKSNNVFDGVFNKKFSLENILIRNLFESIRIKSCS